MTAADQAEALRQVLRAVLNDAGHDTDNIATCWPPVVASDHQGVQLAVCACGTAVEIPGGLEAQMQGRGLAVGSAPPAAADPVRPGLPLLDPSEITTPDQLEAHLIDVIGRLEAGQLFERECIEAEYAAKLAWELARAKSVAAGNGAADVRAARALADNEDLYRRWLTAEMMRKATAAAMHNCRSMLSGYQTVSRSVLATYQAGGSPGPTRQR